MAIRKKPANIDIGFNVNKQRYTVGGDLDKVIELDTSDLNIVNRLSKAVPELNKLTDKWEKANESAEALSTAEDADSALKHSKEFSDNMDAMEKAVRQILDDIFDSPVADTILGNTSAFSPVNGYYKFEHIINSLVKCYEQNIQDEAPKFNARKVEKYINKWIKK